MKKKEDFSVEKFFFIFFICICLFEVILIGIAFFGADKIECNLLWCTFTTEKTNMNSINSKTKIISFNQKVCINQECYENITYTDTDTDIDYDPWWQSKWK